MSFSGSRFFSLLLVLPFWGVGRSSGHADDLDGSVATSEQREYFERHVRPVLVEHCYSCHSVGANKVQAGLRVDSRDALLLGGDSGPAIAPGQIDESLLIEAIRYDGYEMPPKGKLPDEVIDAMEHWVEMGAPWPDEDAPVADNGPPSFDLAKRRNEHWAWQPIASPTPPDVRDADWPKDDLDRFILADLESVGLRPAADVDRSALLRRLSFDLTGLPPTRQRLVEFLSDDSAGATAKLVDDLLQSPAFGERWARHWLDLVRYAESRGHEFDNDAPNAYQYRDYVIRALNADVPHDQWIREHIAGDLIDSPRLNPEAGFNESILGTGFWYLGEWVHSPVDIRKDESDRFDNMIDVMSKAFLGVTVSCARCHDHKFDAISTADYYSLCGFLQSSDYRQVRFESIEHNGRVAAQLASLDESYQNQITQLLAKHRLPPPRREPPNPQVASRVVVDYGNLESPPFLQDGYVFGRGPRESGLPYWQRVGDRNELRFAAHSSASSDPFWRDLESISQPPNQQKSRLANLPRSGRTLRTPTFTLNAPRVSCFVQGRGHLVACVDSHRMVFGPLHQQTIRVIKPGDRWVELDLGRYLGHRLHLEFTPEQDAELSVALVLQGATPSDRQWITDRMDKTADRVAVYQSAAMAILDKHAPDLLNQWSEQRDQLRSQVRRRSRLAMAMMDGTGEDGHILIRGNSSKPGELVPRRFLTAIAGDDPMEISSGSGRLELAHRINAPDNPLTPRVIVNRLWHHLMGRGIVETTDDFGVLGGRPTHPELLDHLASEFLADGRSLKRAIRRIVLSRTYQMSCQVDAEAAQIDPKNLRWHHRPPMRLQGEAIRDSLLSIAGTLDPTLYGRSIPIHLTGFMDGRGRPKTSGPIDGAGRRSIYTEVRRNFLSPFMLAFDTPTPFSTMGRRNVSNVPAQALILMNDPFVMQQATEWSDRALAERTTARDRIVWMYETAFARQPTESELKHTLAFVGQVTSDQPTQESSRSVWADLAHALINSKEFLFLR